MLRRLLAERLGRDPRELRFAYGEQGKPRLSDPADGLLPQLPFNLSHSGGLGLAGFSRRGEIGVDIEAVRTLGDRDALTQRYFSVAEQAQYAALPEARRERAFFDGWARKEAFIKAVGRGLSLSLASFDVCLTAREPSLLLGVAPEESRAGPWALRALPVPATHAAAICLQTEAFCLLERGERGLISS